MPPSPRVVSCGIRRQQGSEWRRPTPGPYLQRNGYRHRDLDIRVGPIDVAVHKLRKGNYFPEWLLERRKRAEFALLTVVADCSVAGVSNWVAVVGLVREPAAAVGDLRVR